MLQYSLGNAPQSMGRKEDAARAFESTLRIQPDFAAADQLLKKLKRQIRKDKSRPWPYIIATGFMLVVIVNAAQTVVGRAVMRERIAAQGIGHANGVGHENGRANGFPKHRGKRRH